MSNGNYPLGVSGSDDYFCAPEPPTCGDCAKCVEWVDRLCDESGFVCTATVGSDGIAYAVDPDDAACGEFEALR